jgi:hypothetical protein
MIRIIIAIVVWVVGFTILLEVNISIGGLPTAILMGILCWWFWYFVSKKKEKEEDYSWIEMIPDWKRFLPHRKQKVKVPSKTKKVEVEEEEEEKQGFGYYFFVLIFWGVILEYFFDIEIFEIVFQILSSIVQRLTS